MASDSLPVSLTVNCGFARAGILQLSYLPKGVSRTTLHRRKRAEEFQDLFSSFSLSATYFEEDKVRKVSLFDRHCDKVIKHFSKKWHPTEVKADYVKTFSPSVWTALGFSSKAKHTYSKCTECATKYSNLQKKFPLHPCFTPPDETISLSSIIDKSEKETTRTILGKLNVSYEENFGHIFCSSVVKFCSQSENIEEKRSKLDKKKEKRKLQVSIRNNIDSQFRVKAALSYLFRK